MVSDEVRTKITRYTFKGSLGSSEGIICCVRIRNWRLVRDKSEVFERYITSLGIVDFIEKRYKRVVAVFERAPVKN